MTAWLEIWALPLFGMMALATAFGLLILWVSTKFKVEGNPIVEQINAILPQTQCGQCNYPGCKPYAEAIAKGEAPINQCPPGGQEGIKKLAELLDLEVLDLNPDNGSEEVDQVVEVVEADCIGCTKCIQVCPVDAIVGAAKQMRCRADNRAQHSNEFGLLILSRGTTLIFGLRPFIFA